MWKLSEQRTLQIQQAIRFGFQFVTAWVLIRIVPDQQFLAEYESISILSAGFSAALVFGLIQKLIQSQSKEQDSIATLARMGLILSTGFAVFVFILGYFSPKINHLFALGFAAISIAFHLPGFLLDQWLVLKQKFKMAIGMTIFGHALPFFSTICLTWYQFSVNEIFFSLMCLAFFKWLILIYLTYDIPIQEIKKQWKPLLTLISVFLVAALAEMFDHWFIQQFCSNQELIIFRYGARELPISLIFANAFSNYVSSRIAKDPSENFSEWLKNDTVWVCHQIFLPAFALIFFSKTLFSWIYPANIQEAVFIFDCFLLLAIPRTLFPQSVLLAYGLNQVLFKVTLAETWIHIVSTLILFPFFGFYSAVIATLIAYSFEKIVLLQACYWFKMNPLSWLPWKLWSAYSIVLIGIFYIKWFF